MTDEPVENIILSHGAGLFFECRQALEQCVFLPKPEPAYTLLTIVCCASTLHSKTLPRIFCYGLKGSGKSEFGKFAAGVRAVPVLPAKCTYAAIRNVLNSMSSYESSDEKKEGSLLVWDNLSLESLITNNDLYQLMLAGYSKSSSKIQISSGTAGTNIVFETFSPVIFSSVFPLHIQLELEELHRRLLIVPFKPWELFDKATQAYYSDKGIDSIFDKAMPDYLDFSYLQQLYRSYWDDIGNVESLVKAQLALRKELRSKVSPLRQLSSQFITLISDLLANGIALGAFKDIAEAIAFAHSLDETQKTIQVNSESAAEVLLQSYIEERTEVQRLTNEMLLAQNLPTAKLRVNAEEVKKFLDELQIQGRLERKVGVSERTALMGKLGFRLDKKSWVEI